MVENVNARIVTSASATEVIEEMSAHFKRLQATVEITDTSIKAINPRKDKALVDALTVVTVGLQAVDDGWLLDGTVKNEYKPSWLTILLGLAFIGGLVFGRWGLLVGGALGLIVQAVLIANRGKNAKRDLSEIFDLLKNQLGTAKKAPGISEGFRNCPSCAEPVRIAATKCRFCNSVLEPIDALKQ